MSRITFSLWVLFLFFTFTSCDRLFDHLDEMNPSKPEVKEIATGLATPLGLELDAKNRLWVTEAGSGNNDGQVSLITPSGRVYPVIKGFTSVTDVEGNPSGLNHLISKNGTLYILHGAEGRLYIADVSHFKPGDTPMQASELEYQEIGSFVLNSGFEETNLYNLDFGPEGDLFIVDAAANSVIRRDSETADLSIFATFPSFPNPTPVGPPFIHAVPTGIVFDGTRFFVSTLTGFPFLSGAAVVYELQTDGEFSVYQDGLTTLVDIELGMDRKPVVLQFSEFGETGWTPETGKISRVTRDGHMPLKEGLSFPTDIELSGARKAYVTNLMEGKVLRVIY